jgi:hypothetical protein
LHKIKTVILINGRIPADKTLVSTDKLYKLVGISQKKKMRKKKMQNDWRKRLNTIIPNG